MLLLLGSSPKLDRAQDGDLAKMKNHLMLSQIYVNSKYLVTLRDFMSYSYQGFNFQKSGKAASRAEAGKLKKYKPLTKDYHVIPVGIETLG